MKCFLMALGTKTQFFSGAWTPCMLWTPHTPPHFLLGVSLRRAPTPTPTRTSAWQAGPCSSPGSHPRRDLLGGVGGNVAFYGCAAPVSCPHHQAAAVGAYRLLVYQVFTVSFGLRTPRPTPLLSVPCSTWRTEGAPVFSE